MSMHLHLKGDFAQFIRNKMKNTDRANFRNRLGLFFGVKHGRRLVKISLFMKIGLK